MQLRKSWRWKSCEQAPDLSSFTARKYFQVIFETPYILTVTSRYFVGTYIIPATITGPRPDSIPQTIR